MQVEIWSDVVCPWCYIGKRRFEAAIDKFEATSGEKVTVQYRPFMLDPTAPPVGKPVREVYEKKFGGPEGAESVLNQVTTAAAGDGLDFNMDIALRANTLLAHRLLVLAERHDCQEQVKERLMRAYFTEGVDVGLLDELVSYGAEAGMDGDEVREWLEGDGGLDEVSESLEFAANNGFSGVPTYVIDRRLAVAGAQSPDSFVNLLTRVSQSSGPEMFS